MHKGTRVPVPCCSTRKCRKKWSSWIQPRYGDNGCFCFRNLFLHYEELSLLPDSGQGLAELDPTQPISQQVSVVKYFRITIQGCGSVFIFSGSGSGSRVWGWIPVRIRIQSGSRALMTKNWKKITAENFYFYFFFWSKTAIYLSLGLHKVCPSYRRSLQLSKEAIQHFKIWTFTNFFLLLWVICGLFLPSWIRIPNPDPDPQTRLNTDPIRIRIHNPVTITTKIKKGFFNVLPAVVRVLCSRSGVANPDPDRHSIVKDSGLDQWLDPGQDKAPDRGYSYFFYAQIKKFYKFFFSSFFTETPINIYIYLYKCSYVKHSDEKLFMYIFIPYGYPTCRWSNLSYFPTTLPVLT